MTKVVIVFRVITGAGAASDEMFCTRNVISIVRYYKDMSNLTIFDYIVIFDGILSKNSFTLFSVFSFCL